MGLLDDYSQFEGEVDEDENISDPDVLRRKRAEIERTIVIVDSDLKRLLREKKIFEIEQRKLKKHEQRIRVDRDALDEKLKKMNEEQRLMEEEIHGLKKKLKVLPR